MTISKVFDSYIEEKYERQAHWYVTLSNGETVYQDDERPGLKENSAWLRLKEYVHENALSITSFFIKFRSHVVCVFNQPVSGVFFRHAALGSFGSSKTTAFYLVGTIKDGILTVSKYQVPEIEIITVETRDINESIESIIFNKDNGSQV